MPTERKVGLVAWLQEAISGSNLVILTDYRGLTMAEITALRRSLEKAGASYHVVKNTLFHLALQGAGVEGLEAYLEGPTAVAFVRGEVAVAIKALQAQVAEHAVLRIKGAWMPGQVLSPEGLQTLATLPPRPVLLGQLAGAIQGPLAGLVNGLAGLLQQLVYLLQARSEQAAEVA